MFAKDIMKTEVITIMPDNLISEAVSKMVKNEISGLPVVDKDDKLLGVISESDVLSHGQLLLVPDYLELLEVLLYRQSPDKYREELKETFEEPVENAMSKKVITANPDTPIGEIAINMSDKDINRIVIVENDKVVGIVARRDIISSISNILK
jgi:CBS domain-containing protein